MSLAESKRTGEYVLRIYISQSLNVRSSYTVKVWRDTTVVLVVQSLVKALHLNQSRSYELVEVRRDREEQKRLLRADESPVERMLLWPEDHEQSQRCYFALQEGKWDAVREPQDLCCLPVLDEKSVLDTLHRRFNNKLIYTYASNILVAINPFKFLPIYNPKDVEMYENCALGSKEPHIFAIANAAFRTMLSKRKNQCIVISGESGSGKTQSTNFLIHCLTALSRKGCTSGVERTILGAGPVLEAFGNAKTAYNNNSSRFGKFIQVNFLEGGIVRGATIEKYLLEKCRLVSRKSNERNYHVFYYLLVGSTQEEKEEFKLLDPEDYQYLKQDNPSLEDQAEMKSEFKRLHLAMEMVGFLPATRKQIFSVLSAILHLGNVTYRPKPDGDGVTVGPADVLETLSQLLKVRRELLVEALTKRKAMTSNDVLVLNYSLNEAITARDSMAKSLYSCLFDWIVLRINHALLNKHDAQEAFQCLSIGVLDIFGFEDFKMNSFEQFCINYANEQLQYYCNQNIFLLEQEEYGREGICWTSVDFSDNIGCINLISKKPTGLLHLVDEESSLPRATDDTLLEKLKRQHQDNPFFVPTAVLEQAFIIQHYAGKVKYQIKDFRAKNTDHVRPDLVALLRSSECGYLRQLIGSHPVAVFRWGVLRATLRAMNTFKKAGHKYASEHPESIKRYTRRSLSDMKRQSSAVGRLMSQRSLIDFSFDRSEENPLEVLEDIFATYENKKNNRSSRNKQLIPKNLMDCRSLKLIVDLNLHSHDARALLHLHKKKKTPSISAQFQTSLLKLLETLKKAEPFFVRCIRSNAEKKEMQFDEELVLRQLRYTGMLETVRIKRSGYGAKFTFKEFMDEFRILLPRNCSSPRSDIAELLHKIGMDEKSFQIGRTKVFLKEAERQVLQETLHREVKRRILILQRWFRACLARRNFLMKKSAIISVQRSWRTYRASLRFTAALVIQKAWRESHERAEYLRQMESLSNLQQLHRKRPLQEQRVSKAEESKTEITALPRGKNKPLPPIPTPSPKENGSLKPLQNERQTFITPVPAPVPVPAPAPSPAPASAQSRGPVPAPSPARPDSHVESSPKSESGSSPQTLHRSKPSDMKGKVEKWRERRSEVMIQDSTDIKNLKLNDLKSRGLSVSLDNLTTLSSSESDGSSPSHPEVTIRRRKHSRHKPRLAHARSGLMLQSRDNADVEYWSFPLPPISPSGASFRVSAPMVLDRSQFPAELDGAQMSLKRQTEVIQPQGPQEKGGFFNRYLKKKRSTPQDGNLTLVKSLGEKEEDKSPQSCSPISLTPLTLAKRKRSIRISRGTRLPDQRTGSLERQITDAAELRHLDEFLGNQMNDLQSRTKKLSETEVIFLTATTQFRDTIKSMYALSNPQISYKGLLQGYKSKVSSLAAQKKKDEVPMVVNLFQSVLDGFIRAEIKRTSSETELAKPTKKMKRIRENDKCPDSPLDHSFHTYQVTIMQSCDLCDSFIWGMEKACMCSSCKIVCHRKCMSKIMTLCSKNVDRKTEAGKATVYFGVHLSNLSSGTTPVPLVLEMMLAHVEMNGLYTEGIYRKSGSVCKAKELHLIMETEPKQACLDNYQIHTITGLIKSWLRELPEPLMTFRLYNEFLYAADVPERSERLRAIYRKLEDLPPPNFNTLERLIFHLVRVVKEEAHNRMSANALAIVFAPCVLRCPDVSDPLLSIRDLPKTTLCLEVLILEQTRRYEEKMKEIQQLEHAEALAVKELKLRRQNTILDNPRDQQDVPPMAEAEMEKTLLERIKSIKHEKNKLASRLPELDQDASDYESQDNESLGGLESSLENDITEGQKNTNASMKCSTGNQTNNKRQDGAQMTYGVQDGQKSHVTLPSNQDLVSNGRFSDLDIPFIDDDL